jgi:hypothetical protein
MKKLAVLLVVLAGCEKTVLTMPLEERMGLTAALAADAAPDEAPPKPVEWPAIRADALIGRTRKEIEKTIGEVMTDSSGWLRWEKADAAFRMELDRGRVVEVIVTADTVDKITPGERQSLLAALALNESENCSPRAPCAIEMTKDGVKITALSLVKQRQKTAEAEECQRLQGLRQKVADNWESMMLEEGQDAYANAGGKCGTTLRITWIGCGRPFVHQLQNSDAVVAKTFRDMGFTRVVCSDGFYATASGDL